MIAELMILFLMCMLITIACVLGVLAAEVIVRNFLPTVAEYGSTVASWIRRGIYAVVHRVVYAAGRVWTFIRNALDATKRVGGKVLRFRRKDENKATAEPAAAGA